MGGVDSISSSNFCSAPSLLLLRSVFRPEPRFLLDTAARIIFSPNEISLSLPSISRYHLFHQVIQQQCPIFTPRHSHCCYYKSGPRRYGFSNEIKNAGDKERGGGVVFFCGWRGRDNARSSEVFMAALINFGCILRLPRKSNDLFSVCSSGVLFRLKRRLHEAPIHKITSPQQSGPHLEQPQWWRFYGKHSESIISGDSAFAF